jgi:hypothetical protein
LLSAAFLAEKARRQTIEAGNIASAFEEETRLRKLGDLEVLRDKFFKLKSTKKTRPVQTQRAMF